MRVNGIRGGIDIMTMKNKRRRGLTKKERKKKKRRQLNNKKLIKKYPWLRSLYVY